MRHPRTIVRFCLTVSLVLLTTALAAGHQRSATVVGLSLPEGSLEVSLRPDGQAPLALRNVSGDRWIYDGPTVDLVGTSYTVVLRNRSADRLKVVLGIDGLNIYRKNPLVGRSDADIGSILDPWSRREIPGWQLDLDQAQRFVFAPSDWSEGAGIRPNQVGTLRVEVYREFVPRRSWWRRDVDESAAPEAQEGARSKRSAESRAGRYEQEDSSLGTTSGEDLRHSVRTVHFEAATRYPEARATIDYGNTPPRTLPPRHDRLGLELMPTHDGSRVVDVSRGSKAAAAGLQRGDVIVRVDTRHHPDPDQVRRIWSGKRHGEFLFLRLRRGDNEVALKISS